jgi:hypothetical protein
MLRRLAVFVLVLLLAGCAPAGAGNATSTPTALSQATGTAAGALTSPLMPTAALATPTQTPAAATISAMVPAGAGQAITPAAIASAAPATPGTAITATMTQPTAAVTPTRSSAGQLPAFSHIFVIVMENKEASQILGSSAAPYINQLAGQYAYAADYYGMRHPSLPNYLALTGGSTFGVASDCVTCYVSGDNIAAQLEKAGRTWKAYMESMPQPCYQGAGAQGYAQKHDPFIYYNDIRTNANLCQNIVPLTQFQTDLNQNSVPQFAWITPNLCNDMHDCSVGTGDNWLKTWVPKILASSAWKDNGALFITFDEGVTNAGCCQYATGGKVSTLVISPLVKQGFVSHVPYDHYSLLRTIEEAWGLPLLKNAACDCTKPMSDFFAKP